MSTPSTMLRLTDFRHRRYHLAAISYRHTRSDAFEPWNGLALELGAFGTRINLHSGGCKKVGNALKSANGFCKLQDLADEA